MSTKRIKFTFPQDMVKRPVIYELSKNYQIVTNIRRADVRDDMGWVILDQEGQEDVITEGLKWLVSTGVRVDPIAGDVIEG